MRFAALLLMLLPTRVVADQWEFFHPESVTKLSCKVEQTDLTNYGTAEHRDVFIARAQAERKDGLGTWGMMIGMYPPTIKGRHQAERTCSKWMDEANKRIKEGR